MSVESSSISAAQKLDQWFQTLDADEQHVVADMVRASLIQAANEYTGKSTGAETAGYQLPSFVVGLQGQYAPSLIQSLNFPGTLAAHSIPGCNARALEVIGGLGQH
jgi:hypothetical protein